MTVGAMPAALGGHAVFRRSSPAGHAHEKPSARHTASLSPHQSSPIRRHMNSSHSEKPPEEIRHPDGRIEHPSVKREHTDVRSGRILAFLVICLILGGADFFVVWHMFLSGEREQTHIKASTYPLAPAPSLTLPHEPRLDPLNRVVGNEQANVFQIEADDLRKLNEVGPAEKGFVRIPIQDAMKLVVPRLPVSKQPDQAAGKDDGLRYGGGPNSGRVFEEAQP